MMSEDEMIDDLFDRSGWPPRERLADDDDDLENYQGQWIAFFIFKDGGTRMDDPEEKFDTEGECKQYLDQNLFTYIKDNPSHQIGWRDGYYCSVGNVQDAFPMPFNGDDE